MSDVDPSLPANPVEVARGVVLTSRKEVLLLERVGVRNHGLWECPGGKLDSGESYEAARHREIYEETGFRVERLLSDEPDFNIVTDMDDGRQRVTKFGLMRIISGELRLNPEEHSGFAYANYQTALDFDLTPTSRTALQHYGKAILLLA